MRAGYLDHLGKVQVGDFCRPVAREDGSVLVKMYAGAICGSDLQTVNQRVYDDEKSYSPGFPGHEGIGIVCDTRSDKFREGDIVLTVPPGDHAGCFAEYQVVDDRYLVSVPETGNVQQYLMAQQLGTVVHAMKLFWTSPKQPTVSDTVSIAGAGSAGLFFVQLCRLFGFGRIIVGDRNEYRLAIAQDLGADIVVTNDGESLVRRVLDVTDNAGADLAIEAAGSDVLRRASVRAARPFGIVGCFGAPEHLGLAEFPSYEAYRKALRIQWSRDTQNEPGLESFRRAVGMIESNEIDVTYSLDPTFDLEDIRAAFEEANYPSGYVVKVLIDLLCESQR